MTTTTADPLACVALLVAWLVILTVGAFISDMLERRASQRELERYSGVYDRERVGL